MPTVRNPDFLQNPWLVGYDAHGIQEFITASNRPLAMLGASHTIKRFDEEMAAEATYSVFAGGGRGIELVEGEAAARARSAFLRECFAEKTFGGTMSTAMVPFDYARESASLRWLRQRLDLAKDDCRPPGSGLLVGFQHKSEQCEDCRCYRAECLQQRPHGESKRVCRRCDAMTHAGRESTYRLDETIQSLLDLVGGHDRYVAAISLDGNNLGTFFEGLSGLHATGEASRGINELFVAAHRSARKQITGHCIPLATGGDDLRLFIPQSQVLPYLDTLIRELETGADKLARRPPFAGFDRFGVGIGVVLADPHLPAKRLMEFAHDLERSAKRLCRPGSARSALDFAVLTAGDASRIDPSEREPGDRRPIACGPEWERLKKEAVELAKIPSSQRALLRDAPPSDSAQHPEFANRWRYQVARSSCWQAWYEQTGVNWRDPKDVVDKRPHAVHLDLLHLLRPATDIAPCLIPSL